VNKTLGDLQELHEELIRAISREAGQRLKELLEKKHIYQQVTIDAKSLISAWATKARTLASGNVDEKEFDDAQFIVGTTQALLAERGSSPKGTPVLTLLIENPKLFCSKCGSSEVFRPVWFHDLTNELRKERRFGHSSEPAGDVPGNFQLISILLQCQRCMGEPEAVLVRREKWKLGLHGRSPMEYVDVPKYIPKEEVDYFRDALIASHGGKPLAGLFYLRTFMELFARRVTGETGRRYGDEVMEAYYASLPPANRDSMPNFKEWYGKLSEPIHTGKVNDTLFEEARDAIERHLDMRRVFRISETPPAGKTAEGA
jgi:hypothetical protein